MIRSLESNDLAQVEAIMSGHSLQFPEFIRSQYPPRWSTFLTVKNDKQCGYFVAVAGNGEVTGHAGYIFNEEHGQYEIVGVVVSDQYQRQGIGKALITHIFTKIKEFGNKQVFLYTLGHVDNEATLKFYSHIGFTKTNYESDFFQAGYHRVTFIKDLI